MIKKLYYKLKWIPCKLKNSCIFKLRNIKVGKNIKTLGCLFVRGRGNIRIGDHVTINSCMESNPIGGAVKTIFYIKENGSLTIGSNVGISNSAFFSETCITVEDDVLIGNGCKIYDSDFHSLNYDERVNHNETIKTKPIHIKKGVFIGANTMILKGVTIGEKSIIGAGSVVTKNIPKGEIWAGNPARFIRLID